MDYSLKRKVEHLINEHQNVVFWSDQNIEIYDLLFSGNKNIEIIDYHVDDKLLTNYTKLLSFFSSNSELNSNIQKHNINKEQSTIVNIFYFIKIVYYYITHGDYLRILHKYSNHHFTNQEINLMTKIFTYSKKNYDEKKNCNIKNKILVINNINYANENDIIFIKKLIESKFFHNYAKKLKIIIISSSDFILDIKLNTLNKSNVLKIVFSDDELCNYIKEINNDIKIPNEKLKQYLKLCKNDFNLIYSIIQLSYVKDKSLLYDQNFIKLKEIIYEILEKFPQLSVLEIAAVIGLSFDLTILRDIADIEIDDLIGKLDDAYKQGILIKNKIYNYEFINNFIRHIIYTHGNSNSNWHKKYAKKINTVYPDEHALIAVHFFKGIDYESAIFHYWAYLLTSTIDSKSLSTTKENLKEILDIIENTLNLNTINIKIEEMLLSYKNHNLEKETLKKDTDMLDTDNYVNMLNFVKQTLLYVGKYTTSEAEFNDLSKRLEKSYTFLENNNILGLQIRCGLYLIDIYSYRLNNICKAKIINEKMNKIINKIINMPNLSDGNLSNQSLALKLIRKTAVLKNPEVAYHKTKDILKANQKNKGILDEIELYKFISDHIGYGLYSGFYDDISDVILKEAEYYLEIGKEFNYPKLYKLRINYFLCKLYTKKYTITEINNFLKKEKKYRDITSSMYRYDIAAIAMLCSKYKYAEKILLELYDELHYNNTCFYNYCYNANMASLYILMRNYEKAKYYNNLILNNNYNWEKSFIKIMKLRAEKFNEFILQKKEFSAKQLFNCFADPSIYPSDTWRFLGKGIVFSELMFYRE